MNKTIKSYKVCVINFVLYTCTSSTKYTVFFIIYFLRDMEMQLGAKVSQKCFSYVHKICVKVNRILIVLNHILWMRLEEE